MNRIEVTKYLETMYPRHLAYDWDNVGLQVGTLNKPVKKILVTLDVTKDVVREAADLKADLILSHHPLIFQPISSVQFETPKGWIIQELVKKDIALYSMHTNFDVADGGMNDRLSERLGLRDTKLLDEELGIGRYGRINPMPMPEFISYVKKQLEVTHVRLIGNMNKTVEIVGISGGSGSQHMHQAKKRGCDVYITGDVTYHNALDAIMMGYTIIDVGHNVEKIFIPSIIDDIRKEFPYLDIAASTVDTNPYQEK
ncbi:MAG TPA: Nif3-like dinuclear metal center hexameric protein [Bacillota bacterium]|nr:Nif3-like dinuclear metal center hexameric protein [Bacillota bacterium]HRX91747.1 Nif3-like dinuclear metal center hexameric protein [Candidatus Izemoplasmatales bacterium]